LKRYFTQTLVLATTLIIASTKITNAESDAKIRIGDSMERVIEVLGKPRGKMGSRSYAMWTYRIGTVEFEDGKVTGSKLMTESQAQDKEDDLVAREKARNEKQTTRPHYPPPPPGARRRISGRNPAASKTASSSTQKTVTSTLDHATLSKMSGLPVDQLNNLQTSATISGKSYSLTTYGARKNLKSSEKAKYVRANMIPFRVTFNLKETYINKNKRVSRTKTDGNANVLVLSPEGAIVAKTTMSLAKLCPT
jgi:hypothetical protein